VAGKDPILVVGGGLGGLTAALALARAGWPVRVLEGAPNFGAIGYGIQFGPNVFHVFDRIGVKQQVLAKSDSPPAVLMLDALTGAELVRVPTGRSFRDRFTYPYIIIHRIDLHDVLLDACRRADAIELVPDAMVCDFEDLGDRVSVRTEDGKVFGGAALIGADGLGSRVRGKLREEAAPRLNGYVAHRTIIPMPRVPDGVLREEVVLWSGPGYHLVHYPLRHGTLFNIVAVFRTATYAGTADASAYRGELEKTYGAAQPAMMALLQMMDLDRRWAIADRDPIRHWSRGRMTLLGDAAHPTLQSLAQGACMAIEDGLCLAERIDRAGGDLAGAFRQYEAARLIRTARVTLESRALWEFYHAEGIARDARNATTAEWSEAHMFDCLAWLYDGFPFLTEPPRNQTPPC
jgi:2-polyprenyl-6-methoxyphenol hydroxylase-like FAD-dependent oxidoreductase